MKEMQHILLPVIDTCAIDDSDPTGYSLHGDFQSGWDVDVLQNAIDHCNNPNDDTGAGVV